MSGESQDFAISTKKALSSWFRILLFILFILIVWGAIVRLTGSGLSIPEWPIVNGTLLPPFSEDDWETVYKRYYLDVFHITDLTGADLISMSKFKTMFAIEYTHRFIAAVSGIIFLVLLWEVFRNRRARKNVGGFMIAALLALILQVVLGGIVVKEELKADLVAAHLAVAYLFFAFVLWSHLRLSKSEALAKISFAPNRLTLFSIVAAIALFLQIISGGLMAGSSAGHILNTFPKMGKVWIPGAADLFSEHYGGFWQNLTRNPILIQLIHRWWLLIVIIAIGLIHANRKGIQLSKRGRFAITSGGVLLVVQLLFGVGNLMMKVPVYMSASHSALALLLFWSLVTCWFEAKYQG